MIGKQRARRIAIVLSVSFSILTISAFIVFANDVGGSATQQNLSAAPAGHPANTSAPRSSDDTILRKHGYVGDGRSHPLSSVTSLNGISTAGWTLSQWQAALPAAQAMSDEMDWAATQSYIEGATVPIAVTFPPGVGLFNKPLRVCRQSVAFFGQGGISYADAQASLRFTGGTDGIDHCPGVATKIELHDIQINAQTVDGTYLTDGTGIEDRSANLDYLENVQVNGFKNCIHFANAGGTHLRFVFCSSQQKPGAATNTGAGIKIEGANSFVNHMDDVLVQNYYLGYWFHSTNTLPAVGIEDTQVADSACGGVRTCLQIDSQDPRYGPFNYSFTNMSVDATTQFINTPNVNDLLVTGGNWLIDPPIAGTSWGATVGGQGGNTPANLIDIGTSTSGANMVRIKDLWFGNASNVVVNSLVSVEGAAGDVQIIGNKVETANMNVRGSYFQVAAAAKLVIERDTSWVLHFAPIEPPPNAVFNASAAPTIRMESAAMGSPSVTNCGLSPSVRGTGTEGVITEGSGSPTTCTLNFKRPYRTLVPICVFQPSQGAFPLTIGPQTTRFVTFRHAAASLVVAYRCTAH